MTRKRYVPPELEGQQVAPGFWPVIGAAKRMRDGRSPYVRALHGALKRATGKESAFTAPINQNFDAIPAKEKS